MFDDFILWTEIRDKQVETEKRIYVLLVISHQIKSVQKGCVKQH